MYVPREFIGASSLGCLSLRSPQGKCGLYCLVFWLGQNGFHEVGVGVGVVFCGSLQHMFAGGAWQRSIQFGPPDIPL